MLPACCLLADDWSEGRGRKQRGPSANPYHCAQSKVFSTRLNLFFPSLASKKNTYPLHKAKEVKARSSNSSLTS